MFLRCQRKQLNGQCYECWSDLGLRPVYHQLACRVEAHILVCFLVLAMWRTLEQWMSGKRLGTILRMDVVVLVRRGEDRIELRVRTVARPVPQVAELLQHLGLRLPVRNRVIAGCEGLD